MNHSEQSITVYSDYVCPFCYLGRQSLAHYLSARDRELAVDWHPYDLRRHKRGSDGEIDHAVEDGKDDAYFDQVRENVARLKEEYDAAEMLDFDALPENVDSFDAQAAALYVKTEYPDRWDGFDEAIFEALWVEGRDIGDGTVLAAIAEEAGVDGQEIRAAVADEDLKGRLRDRFAAAHQAGITGVPTFVYDGNAARGAVPPTQLARLVEG